MAYGDFKDLAKRTASDKVLRDKAFNIAKNPEYDGHQRGLVSMVYKFFDKKSTGSAVNTHPYNKIQLTEELHKPIIKKSSLFWIQRQYLGCWFDWYAISKQF